MKRSGEASRFPRITVGWIEIWQTPRTRPSWRRMQCHLEVPAGVRARTRAASVVTQEAVRAAPEV